MNRSKLRGYVAGPKVSIKDRVGLPKSLAGAGAGGRKGILSRKTPGQGKLLASRLGLPVKSRVGVGSGLATVGGKRKGLVSDARDKIILNRVSKGRIGGGIAGRASAGRLGVGGAGATGVGTGVGRGRVLDARAKIEAKRSTQKKPGSLQGKTQGGNAKLKSLKITANLASSGSGLYSASPSSRYSSGGSRALGARSSPVGLGPRSSGGLGLRSAGGSGIGSGLGIPSSARATSGYRRDPVSHGYFANEPYTSSPGRGSLRISVAGGPVSSHQHQHHPHQHGPPMDPRMMGGSSADSLFLTRTVTNYQAVGGGGGPPSSSSNSSSHNRGWTSSVAKVAPSFASRSGYGPEDMDMDEELPQRIRISNSLQSRLDSHEEESPRYKLIVSNLQPTVTTEDIVELFSDINTPISASITSPGHAEVVYGKKGDCLKAVEAYHNRLLDGSPMRVFMENSSTSLKSAGGATMKLPKASSSVKIQPDISAIHKVLFNPSSGNSTRGLFKGGQ